MAIIITNGEIFISYTETGGTMYAATISEAHIFTSLSDAVRGMQKAPVKTKDFNVIDTVTNQVLWSWSANREQTAKNSDKKPKRKQIPIDIRKMLYDKAAGYCEICGKGILFQDMSVDHIQPLAKGGLDTVSNYQCVCRECNHCKANIIPGEFENHINNIFLHQMGKRYSGSLRWRLVRWGLQGML